VQTSPPLLRRGQRGGGEACRCGDFREKQFMPISLASPPEKRYIFTELQHHLAPMKSVNRHNRRSIRLKEYDYSQPREYFLTICTNNHEYIFGNIIHEEMKLSTEVTIA
jgi:hypothetical protein